MNIKLSAIFKNRKLFSGYCDIIHIDDIQYVEKYYLEAVEHDNIPAVKYLMNFVRTTEMSEWFWHDFSDITKNLVDRKNMKC